MQRIIFLVLGLAVANCSNPDRRFSSTSEDAGSNPSSAAPDGAAIVDASADAAGLVDATTTGTRVPEPDLDASTPTDEAVDATATAPIRDAAPDGAETPTTDACVGDSGDQRPCDDRCSAALECCRDEDCGAGSRCLDNQCEDTLPPQITAFSPLDGSTGVLADTVIEITFSEPMNTDAVEAALSVSSIPQSELNTSWNAEETTLSITPKDGLLYSSTASEAEPARSYTVTIGTAARDRTGNPLDAATSFTFTTMKRVTRTLSPSAAGDYATYARSVGDAPFMCPTTTGAVRSGWWISVASGGTWYGFVLFDLGELGEIHALESATFVAEQLEPDDGFYPSGKVVLQKLQPGRIDIPAVLDLEIAHDYGTFASSAATTRPSLEVTDEVNADREAEATQLVFRLDHTGEPESGAYAEFSCGGFGLNVTYLVP